MGGICSYIIEMYANVPMKPSAMYNEHMPTKTF